MMHIIKLAAFVTFMGVGAIAGCQEHGTMEKTGAKIDEMVDKADQSVQEANEKIEGAIDDAEKKIEKTTKAKQE